MLWLDATFIVGVLLLLTSSLIRQRHYRKHVLLAGMLLVVITYTITVAVLGPEVIHWYHLEQFLLPPPH
jgi:hypothetical protein